MLSLEIMQTTHKWVVFMLKNPEIKKIEIWFKDTHVLLKTDKKGDIDITTINKNF